MGGGEMGGKTMALCPSRFYTKYSKQTKEEVGGDFGGGGEAHGNTTRTVHVFHLTILFPLPLFSSIWQYRFSLQIRHHRVRAPPPPTPPLHVNIYFSQLQTYALLRYIGGWGGGGGGGPHAGQGSYIY